MSNPIKHFGFNPQNYKYLLIGLGINIMGFVLMMGGRSEDPAVFNEDALFSTTRITIAPILIVVGYVVILFSIMKKNQTPPSIEAEAKSDKKPIK